MSAWQTDAYVWPDAARSRRARLFLCIAFDRLVDDRYSVRLSGDGNSTMRNRVSSTVRHRGRLPHWVAVAGIRALNRLSGGSLVYARLPNQSAVGAASPNRRPARGTRQRHATPQPSKARRLASATPFRLFSYHPCTDYGRATTTFSIFIPTLIFVPPRSANSNLPLCLIVIW